MAAGEAIGRLGDESHGRRGPLALKPPFEEEVQEFPAQGNRHPERRLSLADPGHPAPVEYQEANGSQADQGDGDLGIADSRDAVRQEGRCTPIGAVPGQPCRDPFVNEVGLGSVGRRGHRPERAANRQQGNQCPE